MFLYQKLTLITLKNRYESHFKHLLINLYKHKPLLFQLNIFQDPQFFITLE